MKHISQKYALFLSLASTAICATTSFAQLVCGHMPEKNIGSHIHNIDLPFPENFTYVELQYNANPVWRTFWEPLPVPHYGVLKSKRLNVIESVNYSPDGGPYSVDGTSGAAIVRNSNPNCERASYHITYTLSVSGAETWETSSEISNEEAIEEAVKFGVEYSGTSLEWGLSNTSRYSTTSGISYSASAQIGSGISVSVDRDISPCHEYILMPVTQRQDYRVETRYFQIVYDIDGYFDLDYDDTWDTPGVWSISCTPTGHSAISYFSEASVLVGPTTIDDRGQRPIPASDCPCTDDGGDDTDGDGILDVDDDDMDGDGITNNHDGDTDGDGIDNDTDTDDDNDGIFDSQDDSSTGPDGNDDVDGDGIDNGHDDDIDGDGKLNGEDPDMDGDGINNEDDADMNANGVNDLSDLLDAIRRFLHWINEIIRHLF